MTTTKPLVSPEPVLRCAGVVAGHDGVAVVTGLDLVVCEGEVVALLGANGVGKTTTLLSISGLIPLLDGKIEMFGQDLSATQRNRFGLTRRSSRSKQVVDRARAGIAHVPEDRALFFDLTVRQNLCLAARQKASKRQAPRIQSSVGPVEPLEPVEPVEPIAPVGTSGRAGFLTEAELLDQVLEYFPALVALLEQPAGVLSGGQQQMLAIGRGLMSQPKLLMVDELSLGLAPILVEQLLPVLRSIAQATGIAVLIVEQHVHLALAVSDRAYLLRRGKSAVSGTSAELAARSDLVEAGYFGD
jgi:branched-chain amino acid transport system ATP-binding protein